MLPPDVMLLVVATVVTLAGSVAAFKVAGETKSAPSTAMDGAPVLAVFLSSPVASPDSNTPFSPAAVPVVLWLKVGQLVNSAALTGGSWLVPFNCTRLPAPVPTV